MTQKQFLIEVFSAMAVLLPPTLLVYFELKWVFHRWRHRRAQPPPRFWPRRFERRARLLDWALHISFLLILACAWFAFFIEPNRLEVNLVELRSERIRPETGKIRVLHLSDVHSEAEARLEPRVVEIASHLKPDIIVMTGDYINEQAGLPVFEKMMAGLRAPLGVFVVNGNYDYGHKGLARSLRSMPVSWLSANAGEVDVRGTRLRIIGVDVGNEPFATPLLAPGIRHEAGHPFTLLLYHYSDLAFEASEAGVDLYLAGHSHGGQVRLPFYGAVITLAKFGKTFESGLYKVGDMALYVSRGIGMEGGSAPRARFLCRPEVTAFDLLPPQAP